MQALHTIIYLLIISVLKEFDFVFAENGMVAYVDGELKATQSLSKAIGEEQLQEFINYALGYLSKVKLPRKRGNFIELRNGMINICPVGRSCTQEERIEFYEYDKVIFYALFIFLNFYCIL